MFENFIIRGILAALDLFHKTFVANLKLRVATEAD